MSVNGSFSFFVQWHLTERCNLACTHCYQGETSPKELSLPQILSVMEQISTMIASWSEAYGIDFTPSFNITGGEPFLRRDLFRILEAAKARGVAVYLLTNGTLIDRQRAKRLSDLGIDGVQVSLEGPRAIHDLIRGEGNFARSLSGIGHLTEVRVPVTLNATLSRVNYLNFREMIDLARELRVQRLGFSRLVPSGRGTGLMDAMLSREEVKRLYGDIFSLDIPELELVTGDPIASEMEDGSGARAFDEVARGGCAAAVSGITLMADGTVTPCRRLPIPIGNVLTDSLREIWATSEVLQRLRNRDLYKGKCGRCERWSSCRGCRAIAYAHSFCLGAGDYLADDPQCFIQIDDEKH
ncbi:MAG TPA: radical SAM protein [Syntrophorhabdaceae bacterium]|jgi:radical SAM protein with 4Fe4S-binding SPASM domain